MTNTKSMIHDLTVGDLRKKLIAFAVPFMMTNMMQALYNIVDMIFIGQYVGSTGLSAVSIGGMLTTIMLEFGIGISTGGQIFIAQLVGAKRQEGLRSAVWTLFSLIVILAIVIGGVGITFCQTFLQWVNTPAAATELASDYFCCCCAGMIFLFGYNAIGAVLRGMGNSSKPMHFAAISTAVNILLDLLFIGVLDMSAFGAALATVIAQTVAFICSLVYLFRMRHSIDLTPNRKAFLHLRKNILIIVKLGAPLILMQIAIKGSMMFINSYINGFGVSASAVVGVGDKLYGVVTIVTGAIVAAVSATVAQNMGAKKPERARQAVLIGLLIDSVFVAVLTVLVLLFPEAIFRAFTNDPEVISLAPKYLNISLIMYWCFALMCPTIGLITGVGNTLLNSIIGILDSVIARIGLSLLLGITCHMGLWGFVLGSALAGIVSVVIGFAYFLSGKWKTRVIL